MCCGKGKGHGTSSGGGEGNELDDLPPPRQPNSSRTTSPEPVGGIRRTQRGDRPTSWIHILPQTEEITVKRALFEWLAPVDEPRPTAQQIQDEEDRIRPVSFVLPPSPVVPLRAASRAVRPEPPAVALNHPRPVQNAQPRAPLYRAEPPAAVDKATLKPLLRITAPPETQAAVSIDPLEGHSNVGRPMVREDRSNMTEILNLSQQVKAKGHVRSPSGNVLSADEFMARPDRPKLLEERQENIRRNVAEANRKEREKEVAEVMVKVKAVESKKGKRSFWNCFCGSNEED